MYTYEIIETIRRGNGVLTQAQYMEIVHNSPQIISVNRDYINFNHYSFTCSDCDEEIKFRIVA
jgi:hypothetical protein